MSYIKLADALSCLVARTSFKRKNLSAQGREHLEYYCGNETNNLNHIFWGYQFVKLYYTAKRSSIQSLHV